MTDVVPPDVRSQMMAGIKGKDTQPEVQIRKKLHKAGFRFRIHDKSLPGKPDLVLHKYQAVIFINGCFWHGHNCHLFKWPSTNPEFWQNKINRTKRRDEEKRAALIESGWRVLVIWECALKGKERLQERDLVEQIKRWLRSRDTASEIRGFRLGG